MKSADRIGIKDIAQQRQHEKSTRLMGEHRTVKHAFYELCFLDTYSIYGSEIDVVHTISG